MTFGEKVREARRKLNLSQKELASRLGVSQHTVSAYETDKWEPRTKEALRRLSETLEVSPSYLVSGSGSDDFITMAGREYGYRGKKQAEALVAELAGLFAGGEMAEEDMDALALAVQEAYVEAKKKNRRFVPKKYLKDGGNE